MKYIKTLALDLGPNSIGWAYVLLDEKGFLIEILGMGSRILPTDTKLITNFNTGQSSARAIGRRQKRSSRRRLARFKDRRNKLKLVFTLLDIVPRHLDVLFDDLESPRAFKKGKGNQYKPHELYELRHRAVNKDNSVPVEDFARIVYQYLGRRGYHLLDESEISIDDEKEIKKAKEVNLEEVKITMIKNSGLAPNLNKITKKRDLVVWQITTESGNSFLSDNIKFTELQDLRVWLKVSKKKHAELGFHYASLVNMNNTKDVWAMKKIKLEKELLEKELLPGEFFYQDYERLKGLGEEDKWKVRNEIIERYHLIKEFNIVWDKQVNKGHKGYEKLSDLGFYEKILNRFFLTKWENKKLVLDNSPYKLGLKAEWMKKSLKEFIRDYIIFYRREPTFGANGECELERRWFNKNGMKTSKGWPLVAASNPDYQEFVLWGQIHNLRFIQANGRKLELTDEQKKCIFDAIVRGSNALDKNGNLDAKNINSVLSTAGLLEEDMPINWKKYIKQPDTFFTIKTVVKPYLLDKPNLCVLYEDRAVLRNLWHKIYSLKKEHRAKALSKPCAHWQSTWSHELPSETLAKLKDIGTLPVDLVKDILKVKFPEGAGGYSNKAINKLLPLMRVGFYQEIDELPPAVLKAVIAFQNGEMEDKLYEKTKKTLWKKSPNFLNLDEHHAKAFIYGEISEVEKYNRPSDIKLLKTNSLNQPVVEQVINQSLVLIKDIWKEYGQPEDIKVEMARSLKNSMEARQRMSKSNKEKEERNKGVRNILKELFSDSTIKHDNDFPSNKDHDKFRFWMGTLDKETINATENDIDAYKKWLWDGNRKKSPINKKMIEKYKPLGRSGPSVALYK